MLKVEERNEEKAAKAAETLSQVLGGANYVYSFMDIKDRVRSCLLDGATKEEILQYVSESDYEKGLQYVIEMQDYIENQTDEEKETDDYFGSNCYNFL